MVNSCFSTRRLFLLFFICAVRTVYLWMENSDFFLFANDRHFSMCVCFLEKEKKKNNNSINCYFVSLEPFRGINHAFILPNQNAKILLFMASLVYVCACVRTSVLIVCYRNAEVSCLAYTCCFPCVPTHPHGCHRKWCKALGHRLSYCRIHR